ncbi:uncharacterized protein DS421_11g331220 [Arachis hypogaea]|nr:uncharacterized protein DS421_11g331220 [Arachis hypogaea]
MSFRSAQGRSLFEDSYHGYKDKYFKVRPAKARHPFWLSLEGKRLILTYWSFGAGSNTFIKVTYKGMFAVDKKIADVLLAVFGRNHVNPHLLMGDREVARTYILGMSAEMIGLESFYKTFLEESDEENADGKPEAPPENKEDQAVPSPRDTGMSDKHSDGARVSPIHEEAAGTGHSTSAQQVDDDDLKVIPTPRGRGHSPALKDPSPRCVGSSNLLLSKAEEKLKASEEKAASAEGKLKTSDATVSRLTEREMTLESQLNAAQGRVVAFEKERDVAVSSARAAQAEAEEFKKKHEETVKQGKSVILMTEEALKAQVKIVAPDFDTSAIGVFKTIKDGKIVDMPKK